MEEKRKVVLIINQCNSCHYHEGADGIGGPSEWCYHPDVNKAKPKEIYGENLSRDFPKWCPLPLVKGKTPCLS